MGPPGTLSLRSTVAREGTLELRGHHLSWLLSTRVVPPTAGSRLASPCCAPLQRRRGRAGVNPGCVGTRPSGELQKTASSLGEDREERACLLVGDPAGVK